MSSKLRVVSPFEKAKNDAAVEEILVAFAAHCAASFKEGTVEGDVARFVTIVASRNDRDKRIALVDCGVVASKYNAAVAKLRGAALSAATQERKGKPTTELQKVLIRVAGQLLTVAKGELRFLAPQEPVAPAEPKQRMAVMLGTDVEHSDTHPFKISRRRRGADGMVDAGKPASAEVVLAALQSTNPATAPELLNRFMPRSSKEGDVELFGVWPKTPGSSSPYSLSLRFVDATTGGIIEMHATNPHLVRAMSKRDPKTRKRELTESGKMVDERITAKIKDLLRQRDAKATPEEAEWLRDIFVCCHVNTCRHSSGFMASKETVPDIESIRCPDGHTPTCSRCMQQSHFGDCRVMASLDEETRAFVVANSKPCPSCRNAVMKNNGCNHMTCRCGQHFCWRCLHQFPATIGWVAHDSGDGVCTMRAGVYDGAQAPATVGGGWGGLGGAGAGGAAAPAAVAAAVRVAAVEAAFAEWDAGVGAQMFADAAALDDESEDEPPPGWDSDSEDEMD